MPSIEKHMEISKKRTNNPYREIHEWIDEPQHKDERHDIIKIPETFEMFKEQSGGEAAREYVQHIADDLNGKFNHLMEDVQTLIDKNLTYFGAKK
jgi:DNA phosphorothioation-dependent restriction protein DptG